MNIVLATLCLNEMEWLPHLYAQHKSWPGLRRWVFVEAADRTYAVANPERVSPAGLSVDGTSDFLSSLAENDPRVTYVPYGWCGGPQDGPLDQGKCKARSAYLDVAETVRPDFLFVLDADEFYTRQSQYEVVKTLARASLKTRAWVFKQRHLWKPPSTWTNEEAETFQRISRSRAEAQPCPADYAPPPLAQLLQVKGQLLEAIGGYWAVPHVRAWRWEAGLRYGSNHNWPEDKAGTYLTRKGPIGRVDGIPYSPECLHLGYASSGASRIAKHRYYIARGEGSEPERRLRHTRQMYLNCRVAYEAWKPGDTLPAGASVVPYDGALPEAFLPAPTFNPYLALRPATGGPKPTTSASPPPEPTPLPESTAVRSRIGETT